MKGLTKKQLDVLQFIQKYIQTHKVSPTYREIQQQFSLSSLGSVYNYLKILQRKGVLLSEKYSSRSLYPTDAQPFAGKHLAEIALPFIGYISAGHPITMLSQSQTIAVPEFLVQSPESTYVIRAKGDSLNEEMILDGDLLIVEARADAQPGETIIAIINQHDTLVKRYYPDGDYVRLEGCDPHHQAIMLPAQKLVIQGILVSVLRLYKPVIK